MLITWKTKARIKAQEHNVHKYAVKVCRKARGSLDVTKWGFMTGKPLVYDGQSGRAAETCFYTDFCMLMQNETKGYAGRDNRRESLDVPVTIVTVIFRHPSPSLLVYLYIHIYNYI